MEKWWFVSFSYANGITYTHDNVKGFGDAELKINNSLKTRKVLAEVKKHIESQLKSKGIYNPQVAILNFIELEDEE